MIRVLSVLLGAVAGLSGCAEEVTTHYLGYVEGEVVFVASPFGGELKRLDVTEGRAVEAGAPLFQLDLDPQALRIQETEQRVKKARSILADLEKGRRPSELAAQEARLASARAAKERAERDFERRRELHDAGHTDAVSEEELDRYRAEREVRRAEAASLEADLETARLGGRVDALAAAASEVDALEASLAELRWQVEQKAATAPASGLVQQTLYRVGEYVTAGRPVVSLLPPDNVKIRFFVPQAVLPTVSVGDSVEVRIDGVEHQVHAEVSFLSTEAEFTPPVIYSEDSRSKLVFLVEAIPDRAERARLRPGQPVEVVLEGRQP